MFNEPNPTIFDVMKEVDRARNSEEITRGMANGIIARMTELVGDQGIDKEIERGTLEEIRALLNMGQA